MTEGVVSEGTLAAFMTVGVVSKRSRGPFEAQGFVIDAIMLHVRGDDAR
jgi:hypothetical protein